MDDAGKKKKRRSRILSVAGILAGCLVVRAISELQQMLNRRQEVLLSRSGSLQTAEEELTDDDREEEARVKLTAEELTDVPVPRLLCDGSGAPRTVWASDDDAGSDRDRTELGGGIL